MNLSSVLITTKRYVNIVVTRFIFIGTYTAIRIAKYPDLFWSKGNNRKQISHSERLKDV